MSLRRRENIRGKPDSSSSKNSFIIQTLKKARVLPVLVAFACLGILFVLIRMKGIEQEYKMNEITKILKKRTFESKELKADKARLLSVRQLEIFAQRYGLKEPDEKHIIVIPK